MKGLPLALPVASMNTPENSSSDGGSGSVRVGTVGTARGALRLGSKRFEQLRRRLSERDISVLTTVGELRLATSRHLETLHYRDDATPLTAARKARHTLQRLVDYGLLRRLERQVGGLHAGSAAYIYSLTSRGQRLLALDAPRKRVSEPSWPFIAHTLAIADLVVALHSASVGEPPTPEILDLQTEPNCWRIWTSMSGREVLRPDLYLAAAIGEDELRFFIEVDRGTEHRPAIARKARAYQAYYESGVEQDRDGLFPRVAWTVPNEARARQLLEIFAADDRLTPDLFAVFLDDNAPTQLLI
jgi:hypothetical protein